MPEPQIEEPQDDNLDGVIGEAYDASVDGEPTDGAVTGTEGAEPEPEPEPLSAPHHWPAEHQERFTKADREWQQWLLDRDKDMTAAHTRRSQEIAPFRQSVERWQPVLQEMGATPDRMFDMIMENVYMLRAGTPAQKQNVLLSLARDFGVDFGQPEGPSEEEDPFGVHAQVQAETAELRQEIERLRGGHHQQTVAQQQAAVNAAAQQIQAFVDEKGADGKPAHPYFDEVRGEMEVMAQARAQSGQPIDIASLYDAACWATPSVRAKLQLVEKNKAQAEQAQRTKRARTAGGGLAGGGGGAKEQPDDLRKILEEEYDAALQA